MLEEAATWAPSLFPTAHAIKTAYNLDAVDLTLRRTIPIAAVDKSNNEKPGGKKIRRLQYAVQADFRGKISDQSAEFACQALCQKTWRLDRFSFSPFRCHWAALSEPGVPDPEGSPSPKERAPSSSSPTMDSDKKMRRSCYLLPRTDRRVGDATSKGNPGNKSPGPLTGEGRTVGPDFALYLREQFGTENTDEYSVDDAQKYNASAIRFRFLSSSSGEISYDVERAEREFIPVRPYYVNRHVVSGWESADVLDHEMTFTPGARNFFVVWGFFLAPMFLLAAL